MTKKLLLGYLLMLMSITTLHAQERIITGRITSLEDGSALPGSTVTVKGTSRGATADATGKYSISVPVSGKTTLVFSSIAFTSQEVVLGARSMVDVVLVEAVGMLSEVAVVAYGTQDRRTITGAQTSVKGADLTKASLPTLSDMLQGKVPGLQAVSTGQPGANTQIRIRGIGSITAGADPLYVVDGVPINSGDLSRITTTSNALAGINPNDIEDVTVLKDAASSSIYGSRAANGVILITTKRGKSGPTRFQVNAETGYTDAVIPDIAKPLNKEQYINLTREGLVNANYTQAQIDQIVTTYGASNPETNWFDELTRRGSQQQYNISASGGNNKTTFNISGGYYRQLATTIGSNFKRYTANLNLQHNASEKLSFRLGMNIGSVYQNTPSNSSFFANPIYAAFLLRPTQNPYNADGSINLSLTDFPNGGVYNAIAEANLNRRDYQNVRGIGTARVEYRPLKNLTLSSQYGVDFSMLEEYRYRDPNFGDGYTAKGSASAYYTRYFNWTWTNLAEYRFNLNGAQDFYADLKVGYEAQKSNGYFISTTGTTFPNSPDLTSLVVAATPTLASQTGSDYSFTSLISNVLFDYKKKYNLTGSFRRDGSSRFGINNRYGNFYSVGASWNINEEAFFPKTATLSALKLRASYGVNGNAAISNYQWQATYGFGNNYNQAPGSIPNNVGNADLTWELNKPFNVGIDASLMGNRLNVTVDYYNRTTSQLLLNVPLSRTSGFSTILDNVGSMVNKGWEFSVSANPIQGAIAWNVNANAAINKNQITQLYAGQDILDGQFIRREGLDFQSYYMREWAGVDPQNGNPLWYKNIANADGTLDRSTTTNYNEAQRIVYKSASPKLIGGFGTTLSFKGITLDAQFSYNFGNYMRDGWVNYYFSDGFNPQYNKQVRQLDRWQKPGDVTNVPKYVYNGNNGSYQASTRFLYKADFIRLRAVTLSYSLPQALISKAKLNQVQLYVRGTNLFLFTFDKDLPNDPELSINSQQDLNPFISKIVNAGINIGF
ncbi:SusC/RagA family TonB-linked outer membrane protein [Spirosoma sp. BT702]|uniref:SusC/RagA family TonB-linked outer membrane protein n=1 Tax=Spirosoma profusum TaxID=2771354 RepID=A0A927ASA5_9BACT|nr:SusC/RagA family TonB-linked outer membrane protein [Spirosoma profusum]MBD2700965.1 SusC/RagA family TonB-linked outer membrane protein [Spirosoma profusum]